MSLEPNARRRLQLVAATTRDPELLKDLRQVLQVPEEDPMSFVPSAELLRRIATCAECTQDAPRAGRAGLCDDHRACWNLEVCTADRGDRNAEPSLERLVHGVLASPEGGAQLLSALEQQRRALSLVWEAHNRGVVRLPESIAACVERAYENGPRFLAGSRPKVQQAS